MVATILGGALLQWPVGRLSDRVDRRIGLALACLAAAGVSVLALFAGDWGPWPVYALFFTFGGLAFSIYPMSVAHMLDTLPPEDLLSRARDWVSAASAPEAAAEAAHALQKKISEQVRLTPLSWWQQGLLAVQNGQAQLLLLDGWCDRHLGDSAPAFA